jgi:hypothetical protein
MAAGLSKSIWDPEVTWPLITASHLPNPSQTGSALASAAGGPPEPRRQHHPARAQATAQPRGGGGGRGAANEGADDTRVRGYMARIVWSVYGRWS